MASATCTRTIGLLELRRCLSAKNLISPAVRWTNFKDWIHDQGLTNHLCRRHAHQFTSFSAFRHTVNHRLKHSIHKHRLLHTYSVLSQMHVVQEPKTLSATDVVIKQDLATMGEVIKQELETYRPELEAVSSYYFDGQGKAFRPMVVVLMARAINHHLHKESRLLETQLKMALITEMIHTASLVHDDVIDTADLRRGKPSINFVWGQKKPIFAGDFILSRAAKILAAIGSEDVIVMLSEVLLDLVQGEFMQMGSKQDENERFSHYLQKTFKKTASLIAYTCKCVAYLAKAPDAIQEASFQYGKNLGIAFQLVDDLLDFVSNQAELGKPTAADLKLGLATAPVLFACEKYPELNIMIMRRFAEKGDVERAYELVMKSDGLENTRILARKHCEEAIKHIAPLEESNEKQTLINITDMVLNRKN